MIPAKTKHTFRQKLEVFNLKRFEMQNVTRAFSSAIDPITSEDVTGLELNGAVASEVACAFEDFLHIVEVN